MIRFWKLTLNLALLCLAAGMVLMPRSSMDAAKNAISLCIQVVIPSLFPFFVCSRFLTDQGAGDFLSRHLSRLMRPLFGVPGGGALAVILGIISGYPIGAATIVSLYDAGTCTKTEAERLLTFCNNSGPLFILGSIGVGMLHNQKLGVLLYVIHLLSALITGTLFRRLGKNTSATVTLPPSSNPRNHPAAALAISVSDSVNSMLKVCGFVILFSVFCSILPIQIPWFHALLEITGGIYSLVIQRAASPSLLPIISFFLALSGASVLLQTAGIILPAGLSLRPYFLGKAVQGVIAFLLTHLFCRLFPIPQPAFSGNVPAPPLPTFSQLLALTMVEFLLALLVVGVLCLAGILYEKYQTKK